MRTCRFFSVLQTVAFIAALAALVQPLGATPYASGVSISGGTVTFILNEAADDVIVVFDGGASTQDLGPLPRGRNSFALGAAATFQIIVKKDSAPGYSQGVISQTSSDSNPLVRFVNQRGVVVNKNPASPAFGRIYVSVSAAGTTAGRTLGDGIYVLNADQSEIPELGTNALTGSLNFTNGSGGNTESPHRLSLGPDDMLYIGDWSDSSGSLYVTDRDVANGQNVLGGPIGGPFPLTTSRIHGSISASWIEGSLASGDLTVYVIDEDLQTDRTTTSQTERNSLWRWDIGSGPLPATTSPTRIPSGLLGIASQLADVVRGPDNKFYTSQRRAEPATSSGVFVRSPDGLTTLWSSLAASRTYLNNGGANDLLGETAAIDVSRDGKYLAVLRRDTNSISILPLYGGIPDITNRIVLVTSPTTGVARDIAFDLADNLYYVSSGQGLLRVFSPGGRTTATTGSDGTFSVVTENLPQVSVVASDAEASEDGFNGGAFTVSRTGDLSQPLTVAYSMSGLAMNGEDYDLLPLSLTFQPGESSLVIPVDIIDDDVAELQETATLNLSFGTDYLLHSPTNATIYIADNEPVTLRLSGGKTNMFEPLPADTGTLIVTRLGITNVDVFSVILETSGTANEADYQLSTNEFYFPVGVVSMNVTLSPINDFDVEGTESVTVRLGASNEYISDPANTVSFFIRDDDAAPAPIAFSDDLNGDHSSQWQTRFGAVNGIYDASVVWGYDYGALTGPAPRTTDGTTVGLWVGVNKNDSTAGGSAGINFYPIGQSFSGDYALRFDMYLSVGAANTTEHAIFGLNHSGSVTNRATQNADPNNSTAGGDGVWVGIVTDASDLRDYSAYSYPTPTSLPQILTNRSASTLTRVITRPPYAFAGSPSSSGSNRSWAEVELSQIGGWITLKVNDNVIWTMTNSTPYRSGDVMIGMNDQFDSVSSANTFVIFDNVQVLNLNLQIGAVELLSGNQIQIDFASPQGGQASDFALQSRSDLAGGSWADDPSAVITSLGNGRFRAVTSQSGTERYYRIRK